PDHEDDATGDVRRQYGMKRVAHRIHDGSDLGGNALQRQHVGGGHDDVLGEGAVPIHPDDPGVAADVAVAGAALEAVPAHDVSLGGHQLADFQLRDVVAHLHDFARELVAHHHRRLDPALRPGVP